MSYNKKIANYFNTAPTFVPVMSDQLISGMEYQRSIKSKNFMKIVEDFAPMRFIPPIVNYRDGKYHLVDGQHRVAALVYMNGGKPIKVFCVVYENATFEEEADTAASLDSDRHRMTPLEIHRAEMCGGSDKSRIARAFNAACDEVGITLLNAANDRPNEYTALTTLKSMYCKYGAGDFKDVMRLIDEAWHGKDGSKKNSIIKAVFSFHSRYKGKYNRKRAVTRFSKEICDRLIITAKSMTGSLNDNLTMLLLNAYNSGLPKESKL